MGHQSAFARAPATATPATRPAIGVASLTIRYPAGFQTARFAKSTVRGSKYVNPTANNLLDIYVDGSLQVNLDGGSSGHSAVVVGSSDGTQTLAIPLYSTSTHDVVVIEFDNTATSILALGEAPSVAFTAGDSPIVAVQMAMNVTNVVFDHHREARNSPHDSRFIRRGTHDVYSAQRILCDVVQLGGCRRLDA